VMLKKKETLQKKETFKGRILGCWRIHPKEAKQEFKKGKDTTGEKSQNKRGNGKGGMSGGFERVSTGETKSEDHMMYPLDDHITEGKVCNTTVFKRQSQEQGSLRKYKHE